MKRGPYTHPAIMVGASKAALRELKDSILQILATGHAELTLRTALHALMEGAQVSNTVISNCMFYALPVPPLKKGDDDE